MRSFPRVQERLTQLREHHDIEKEVEVKTFLREKELPAPAWLD